SILVRSPPKREAQYQDQALCVGLFCDIALGARIERVEAQLIAAAAAAEAGLRYYLALVDGVPAGAGSMRIADGVAQMTGAATAPDEGATSRSSRPSPARSPSRTCSGAASTCVTRGPFSSNPQRYSSDRRPGAQRGLDVRPRQAGRDPDRRDV